jgi:hypothetical protein
MPAFVHTALAAIVPGLLGLGGYRLVATGDPSWMVAAAVASGALAAAVAAGREREL